MAGRGPQTFKKRQKEQQRKEKQQEKIAKRLERKRQGPSMESDIEEAPLESGIDASSESETSTPSENEVRQG
jgi:hypothetical protein